MPALLVHGVPETSQLWDPVRRLLNRTDVSAVALPGFGNPRPAGFGATMDEYAAWLIGAVEQAVSDAGEPVDLVGHDWGGGFVNRLVSTRPELVRTWVTDVAGLMDVDFVWHDFAKIWQTPGDGEVFWEQQLAATPAERASVLSAFGVPEADALVLAAAGDQEMADCILALYRSATAVHEAWGPQFVDIPAPGLVVIPALDPFLNADGARRAAGRAGARVEELGDLGHWWMVQDPARAAGLLEGFWASA